MRGRPKQYYVGDRKMCQDCKYSRYITPLIKACSYIDITGNSRIYREDGSRRCKNGYCVMFKEV
jgi:hypothetical protein